MTMRPLHVALLGPPGAGKGTQSRALCERFGLVSVAPGDLFRTAVKNGTPLGLRALAYMARGELVPDEIVDGMIETFMAGLGPEQGAVFDGFPRTTYQCQFLDELLGRLGRTLDVAVLLDVPDNVVFERLADRPVDITGGVHAHLRTYHRTIPSVLSYYEASRRLAMLDADADVESVTEQVVVLLEIFGSGAVPAPVDRARMPVPPAPPPMRRPPSRRTMDVVLLGGPGSGKGTQAVELSSALSVPHISTGDLFRENLRAETELGCTAKAYMDRGELVPDEVTEEMVKDRLEQPDAEAGFVLDGYPRSRSQAVCLDDMLAAMGRAVAVALQIVVPDGEIIRRLSGRLTCAHCQSSYHLEFKPPAVEGVCDVCGRRELYQRDDDKPETIAARLRTFHGNEVRLLDHYRQLGLLVDVDGTGDAADVTDRVLAAAKSAAAAV